MIDAVGAAQTQSVVKKDEATLLKDDFLKLLVTQMENQDPLNPVENTEFTAQLAQFTSLEQLFNINDNLKAFENLQSTLSNTQAISYLGKEVKAEGSLFNLSGGSASVNYTLSAPADDSYIGIYNAAGDLVRSVPMGKQPGGENSFVWDGKDKSGVPMPDGIYSFVVGASSGEEAVESKGYISGTVDGISYDDNGSPVISVNGIKVSSADIKNIK